MFVSAYYCAYFVLVCFLYFPYYFFIASNIKGLVLETLLLLFLVACLVSQHEDVFLMCFETKHFYKSLCLLNSVNSK